MRLSSSTTPSRTPPPPLVIGSPSMTKNRGGIRPIYPARILSSSSPSPHPHPPHPHPPHLLLTLSRMSIIRTTISRYGNAHGVVQLALPHKAGVYEARLFAAGSKYNEQATVDFTVVDNDFVTAVCWGESGVRGREGEREG